MKSAALELRSTPTVSDDVYRKMSRLHESTLASKRPCYTSPAESSRGTLSSGTSGSNSRSPVSAQSRSQVPGHAVADGSAGSVPYIAGISPAYAEPNGVALEATDFAVVQGHHRQWNSAMRDPFMYSTIRSTSHDGRESIAVEWEQDCVAPVMSRAEAEGTTGAFMAKGRAKAVMEALEKVLQDMGAKVRDAFGMPGMSRGSRCWALRIRPPAFSIRRRSAFSTCKRSVDKRPGKDFCLR